MKKELNEMELEEVTGGTVTLSANLGMVQFSTMGKSFMLKPGIDFKTVRSCLLDLYDENANMADKDFDRLVAKTFRARGFI